MTDWDRDAFENAMIDDMRAHDGAVTSGPLAGHPLLIMNTTGAKSGEQRRAILTWSRDAGDYVVAGTAGGSTTTPAWVHNLEAHPRRRRSRSEQQGRGDHAGHPLGPERDRLWDQHVAELPNFADYPKQTGRLIPMIRITPAEGLTRAAPARPTGGIIGRCATARSRRSSPRVGHARRRRRPVDLLGGVGQPGRQARGRAPWRTRQRQQPGQAPLVRPRPLPARPARPARLRPEHAARRRPRDRPVDQHDPPPDRRHRAAARAPGHRALARVGRVVGRDPRPRLRRAVPGARDRDGPAVDHDDAPCRRALAGPRDRPLLPRAVGAIPRRRARGRPGRPRRRRTTGCSTTRRTPPCASRRSIDWMAWEDAILSLEEGYEVPHPRWADERFGSAFARLVTHYFSHAALLEDDELLRNAHRLAGIPAVLLHGRLDLSGRPTSRGSSPRPGPARSCTSSRAATRATRRWTACCSRRRLGSPADDDGGRTRRRIAVETVDNRLAMSRGAVHCERPTQGGEFEWAT